MASVEEKVEEKYKKILSSVDVRHYGKTEEINPSITAALKQADSKSGGNGKNYPDIQLLLDNKHGRRIPVMMEAKGHKGGLEKLNKDGEIIGITYFEKDSGTHKAGDPNYSAVQQYAVNGALHYGSAILDGGDYTEVIIVGLNGSQLDKNGDVVDAEFKAYYVSEKNNRVPKLIKRLDAYMKLFKQMNIDKLYKELDTLNLSDEEREKIRSKAEATLEERVKGIHQSLYDDKNLKTALGTNEKLYLFCGLIMAGLSVEGVAPLNVSDFAGNDDDEDNDGTKILTRIKSFLKKKKCSDDKIDMIVGLLTPVFRKNVLWKPTNGESIIRNLFKQVKQDIIPCLESNLHLDFTGKILNSLNDWVSIENDAKNDVVLTPRYVTTFMARLARTDKDSFVWDRAMGSAGFLVSAMDIMIKDASDKISDEEELDEKIRHIKEQQLLGIEILGNIYILAVLNMILMGDGSSNIINGDSHDTTLGEGFPATVFLLNPPYSADGKGFNFVEEALSQMTKGYACVLIQENAGAGQGLPYTKRILQKNTLIASIHMPADLFRGKSSPQTAIYVFEVAKPHNTNKLVKFIDFSIDGYRRQARKKSTQEVNLKDIDNAESRYAEVEAIILGEKPKTNYYSRENGNIIEDTISLDGNDWTFNQHKKINIMPTDEDFKRTVADFLAWKVSSILKGEIDL